jgi:hypothetical protein
MPDAKARSSSPIHSMAARIARECDDSMTDGVENQERRPPGGWTALVVQSA